MKNLDRILHSKQRAKDEVKDGRTTDGGESFFSSAIGHRDLEHTVSHDNGGSRLPSTLISIKYCNHYFDTQQEKKN
jgi:hypothetical protein